MTETITQRSRLRERVGLFGGVGLALFATLGALAIGSADLSASAVLAALVGGGTATARTIVWQVRVPRVLAALLAGGGLAVAGAVMQTVLRNPLGAPYTLGISQAAAFGAAIAIVAGITDGPLGTLQTPIAAFAGGLVSTGVILALVTYREATPETMILTGVALGSLFSAGLTLIQYLASDTETAAIVYWTFGDLGRAGWWQVGLLAAVVGLASLYFLRHGWDYDVLDAGTATARSLGVNVTRLRIGGMAVASLVTALVVSFVGIIGFVGLVAPHLVRMVIGGTERSLLPGSILTGATLLVAADTAARTVLAPVVLPVGILTSLLGAPLFLYLVVRGGAYW
ncbi:FecCD family ABC transporter permease [Halococcoides cellulosivorans]|uniref:Cobalamin import system permease protein BtuC n=1 Tax=Halococcoides cellulosivorans TaxID=1679096 RepID=A0A2R4WXM7_9EURY|nr:iron ABC transporter permease [Halococcoides cellulosivorans]AWB26295.1 iron ABC transporter permease [Halococcoides cellulosivorans]